MVTKIYKSLTDEQKQNGVIFSSCLSVCRTEQSDDTKHEVKKDDANKETIIRRLKDDSFFNSSHFKFNIIRE